jgi:glycosyltransferase involved in cell wall biosynthesis
MINNNKSISIAMATYNGSLYLKEQLDSIINQTYKNIEIIIVDDCSIDNTVDIILQYKQQYPFIKLLQNQQNLGIVKSFAKALSKCNGDYIALSDQDDVWFPDKLERLLTNIGDSLLIHSDAVLVDSNMQVIAKSNIDAAKKDRYKSDFTDYLISNNVTGCTALFSKELLKLALPIPAGFYVHDHYLAIIAGFYGKIELLEEPLIYYRQHGNNSIGAARPQFDSFVLHCKVIADSYNALLTMPVFNDNFYIELVRDYRLSIYLGRWTSKFSILRILQLRYGVKLLVYYLIMSGLFGRKFAIAIYNAIFRPK